MSISGNELNESKQNAFDWSSGERAFANVQ
jgi:hypothetical protein